MKNEGRSEIDEISLLMKEVGAVPKGCPRSLYQRRKKWRQIASPFVNRIIEEGASLFFKKGTPKPQIKIVRHPKQVQQKLNQWIKDSLRSGFIEKGKTTVVSPLFCIPKPNGGIRIIIDLRQVNKFQQVPKFRIDRIHHVAAFATPGCMATKIDICDAFHQVEVAKKYRRFLGFSVGGNTFRYKVLPMGSASSPFLFCKVMAAILSTLRKKNVKIISYIDDFLVVGRTYEETKRHTQLVLTTLSEFGFSINWEKSELRPTQKIHFLGFDLHLPKKENDQVLISIPSKKKKEIAHQLERLARCQTPVAKNAAKTLGKATALIPSLREAQLLTRSLSDQIMVAANNGWNSTFKLSASTRTDLKLLASRIRTAAPIYLQPTPEIIVESDASLTGSGAVLRSLDGHILAATSGNFKQKCHINILELRAAFRALRTFRSQLQNKRVLLRLDNTVALSYIRRLTGRKRSLAGLARRIWKFCESKNITLIAQHIKGKYNVFADHESRRSRIHLLPEIASLLEIQHASFPIPKINILREEIKKAIRLGSALITPNWKGANWMPLMREYATRYIKIPRLATNLPTSSFYAKSNKLLLWDFSSKQKVASTLLSQNWRCPIDMKQPFIPHSNISNDS